MIDGMGLSSKYWGHQHVLNLHWSCDVVENVLLVLVTTDTRSPPSYRH